MNELGNLVIDYVKNGHKIVVEKLGKKLKVTKDGAVIADTSEAVVLREDGYGPVYYLPVNDVRSEVLVPTDTKSVCPYKGRASYYSLKLNGKIQADKVWRYSEPKQEFTYIKDFVAFYPDAVDEFLEY